MPKTNIRYRSLIPPEEPQSPHFLAALQVIAHLLGPLRKALIHFHLVCKSKTIERVEWKALQAFGQIFQALIAFTADQGSKVSSSNSANSDSSDEEACQPVDPTHFFSLLEPCLQKLKKSTQPKDATEALQILLETIQKCCRTLPLGSHLWTELIDMAGLGLIAKQSVVGRCNLEDDGEVLQRTKKESIMFWCPWVLPANEARDLQTAVEEYCSRKPFKYDFDHRPYDFEVRVPLLAKVESEDQDTSHWTTTRTIQFTSLTSYLFLGIPRLDGTGKLDSSEWKIPKRLDLSKVCLNKEVEGSKEYDLVGGILHDGDDDYVAILKNPDIDDPEDENAWKLLESEEIIGMTEADVFDFMQGEGEDGPCGTVVVYKRCNEDCHKSMNQLLSDIVIAHVSGTTDSSTEFYYEEEVIED